MPSWSKKTNQTGPSTEDNNVLELGHGDTEVVGSTLSAHDISYQVNVRTKMCCGDVQKKRILSNVTAIFKPGLNALLGTSGSGKTSFMNTLSGRVDKRRVEGKVLVNGQHPPDNFKCLVGYVVQDDVVMGTLTVRENLTFSSALRLPSTVSRSERRDRVERVIKDLGLEHCADTKIGTPFIRGVSGGERKRCNIGMELIISPPVLFLDEPTSGLDASTANTVVMFLKRLAERGRTVILSIHQPRFSIYRLFDSLTILLRGHTIYHGPSLQAIDFFDKQGFKCENHNNPPDFFLDVINGDMTNQLSVSKTNPIMNGTDAGDQDPGVKGQTILEKLTSGFQASEWCSNLNKEASQILAKFETGSEGGQSNIAPKVEYATSFLNQLLVVSGRTFKEIIRNPQTGLTVIASTIFFSLIMVGIYWQLSENPVTAFSDRGGVIFFVILVQMFFNLSAMETMVKERIVLMHENVSGYYRMSVFFLVKVFCDILPLRLAAIAIMTLILYFAVGLRETMEAFFLFLLCLLLVTMVASATCFFMASTFETFAAAQLVMSMIYMIMMLFSGFMINLGSVSSWLGWLQYLSMVKYGLTGMYINEFKDRTFCDSSNITCKAGNTFLEEQNMDFDTSWHFWQNYVALALMSVVLFALAYVQLRRMRKHSS